MITKKSTKAEIWAAYEAQKLAAQSDYVTMVQLKNTARLLRQEFAAAVHDTFRFGAWCRKGFDRVYALCYK